MTGFTLTSLVALLITLAALAFYDLTSFREKMQADVSVLAGVIGQNAASSVVFNDPEGARSVLAALRAHPHMASGHLYDKDGQLFASYTSSGASTPQAAPKDGAFSDPSGISVTRGVMFNDARVGTITLRAGLGELQQRRRRYLEIAVIVLVGASIVALILSWAFERVISRPILNLLEVEKRVSREKNYALRAHKEADDEVGRLIDGFNEMLDEIGARDAEIQERHRQEMALARTIQTSVLPQTFDLPGFDVSAIMMPAEEVGGDFYEFRPAGDGSAWMGIGDVTGHGVTSGLIMMMAQSMFTMMCEQTNGQVSPARFLTLLNRAMFYNLKSRLAQDKFMTMVIARLHRDGRIVFAGAHTDVLIYRAASTTVERIATDGIWLGISEDIEAATKDRTVTLERGDVALFHTDGVTEARNGTGECFDMERLTRKLTEMHKKPASVIVTDIAHAAWRWAGTPTDDVSLLVVKRS